MSAGATTVPDPALPPRAGRSHPVAAGDVDRVEIVTVGIDVGSATYHSSFSRVVMRRRTVDLSTRYDVVHRQQLWASPVSLTPYLGIGDAIDAAEVAATVASGYRLAGLTPDRIDSGAVLLTGTALERGNARALAERLASDAGRFVCAAAGHHLEAVLAAHGSGAVALSLGGPPVVSVDVGGGTAKLALAAGGQVRATAAVAAGARLVAWDGRGRLRRIEASIRPVAAGLGIPLELGRPLPPGAAEALATRLAGAIVDQLRLGGGTGASGAGGDLLLTDPFPAPCGDFLLVVSGGVAEFLDRRDPPSTGDLGPHLAAALAAALDREGLAGHRRPAAERIRATVIGASQHSTQVTGSTIRLADPAVLPLHDVPVLRPQLALGPTVDAGEVADAVRRAAAGRPEAVRPGRAVAVALAWSGAPAHPRLRAVADGLHAARRDVLAAATPLVVTVDHDLAATLGRLLVEEVGADADEIVCLDNLDVGDLDHLDIGRPAPPAGVVPVVVKSLLFAAGPADPPPTTQEEP